MSKYLVSEKGRPSMTILAQYESAAATNYVSAGAKGAFHTVRRVRVRKLIGGMRLGRRFVFDVVDSGTICQAFKPQRCRADALELARLGAIDAEAELRQLATQLGIQGVDKMLYQEVADAVANLMPRDGSSVTLEKIE